MAYWIIEIENELRRAKGTNNPGRIRTIARRVAGIAIQELQTRFPERFYGDNYIHALRGITKDVELPTDILSAAERLQTQLSSDFTSPSVDPIGDAITIVEFVKKRLEEP